MASPNPEQDFALLVDSDADSRAAVRRSLQDTNLALIEVDTVAEALEWVARDEPRLVLSELALPDGSGFALCRQLRESAAFSDVPIVLVSRWSTESDRILAFECGADDFLSKPFFQRELASRIKAVLRRSEVPVERETEETDPPSSLLAIDGERREVRFDGTRLPLTPREFSLLATLARHRGRVLSRADLIAEAWNAGENPTERSVDAHVKSLRRKLDGAKDAIETIRGIGYRFSEKGIARSSR